MALERTSVAQLWFDSPFLPPPSLPQTILLQVELPKGERTVVRVSPSLPLPEVLQYICEKRNLLRSTHRFDLPATEESLVNKTLEQLKINSIRVIEKRTPFYIPYHLCLHSIPTLCPCSILAVGSGIGTPPSQKRKKSVKGRDKASSSESPKVSYHHHLPCCSDHCIM